VRHGGTLFAAPWVADYNRKLRAAIADIPFAAAVSFTDGLQNETEIRSGGNHYERRVYARVADAILKAAASLPAKARG
jgi:hypothetical protein